MYRSLFALLLALSVLPSQAFSLKKVIKEKVIGLKGNETSAALEYYVSPNGNDRDSGDRTRPFRTLGKAKEKIRAMTVANALPKGGVCVLVREGRYYLEDGLEFTGEDSGKSNATITWRAYRDEEVRLTGGRRLPIAAFTPVVDDEILKRLPVEGRSEVRCIDLAALKIRNLSELPKSYRGASGAVELFFNDEPMHLARWPNEGWVTIKKVFERGDKKTPGAFEYSEDRPARWNPETGVWLQGYWCHDWYDEVLKVAKIDPENKRIDFAVGHGYGIGASHSWNKVPRRWYALNLLEELDAPGEWYLDVANSKLYFYPPSDLNRHFKTDPEVVLSLCQKPIIKIGKDARYLTMQGFIIEATRHQGINVAGENCLVAACTIRNTGRNGISISGKDNTAFGNDLYQNGAGGISIGGGDAKKLVAANNRAENNHIHNYARLQRTYAGAISLQGVGNSAVNNLIHDGPHAGILYGGNNNLIERNEIYNTCLETADVGALYTGRSWTSLGNVIRQNFIHHIGGVRGWSMGVYLDDCDSGDRIEENIFYKVKRAAFIGGGRYNTVINNVFVDCSPAVHLDSRGKSRIKWDKKGDSWNLKEKLERYDYKNPPWSTSYPYLVNILDDEPALPRHNKIERNVCVSGKWLNAKGVNLDDQSFKDNWITESDPGFENAGKLDFNFRKDSELPLRIPDFKEIPLEKIGVFESPLRASWPVEKETLEGWYPEKEAVKKIIEKQKSISKLPVFPLGKTGSEIEVDGDIRAEEWRDANETMAIAENIGGGSASPASRAWVMQGNSALYVAVDNPVEKLNSGNVWGKCDAVEVAISTPNGILVLRGFASGHWESSTEAGASKEVARKAKLDAHYAARIIGTNRWSAEWSLPWKSLGLKPEKGKKIPFNITVRKTTPGVWLMWQGTGGWSWETLKAGLLEVK